MFLFQALYQQIRVEKEFISMHKQIQSSSLKVKGKAQSSIEFIILIAAVMVFFVVLLAVFNKNISQKTSEKRNLEVQNLALEIQREITIASEASNGYKRVFIVPPNIIGIEYTISINDTFLYLETANQEHRMTLPIPNLTGQLQKGDNTIEKQNGVILLNQ